MYGLNVLIVEDEKVIAFDLMLIVKKAGFSGVKIAPTAFEALQIIQKERVDILLTDIRLETESAGVTLAKIVQECCHIVPVFITGHYNDLTLKAVSQIAYAGIVIKPFRGEEIEVVLKLAAMRSTSRSRLPESWHYDESGQTLYYERKPFPLSPKEKQLFHLLFRARGSLVTYARIEALLWPDESVSDNARHQLFHRFKKRLEALPITIIRGEGLQLESL
jgi:DNA-binding response OmpR family regulator